ncbi:hypothetical protein BRADI_4g17396v3 [Brachypodium distachyon]|uniref:Uncharacterized protein n=1 Tax=Brachypodium distachyon TaxID=15368 RepID=A0A0Q3ELC1_BRADI|nr:hypothetical protein BRADI_4g17396v3 [Brachypodium distachyon]KQJ88390.1 hypothetical protein BRADI_4g17396v3 [Brachypodium distachyon]
MTECRPPTPPPSSHGRRFPPPPPVAAGPISSSARLAASWTLAEAAASLPPRPPPLRAAVQLSAGFEGAAGRIQGEETPSRLPQPPSPPSYRSLSRKANTTRCRRAPSPSTCWPTIGLLRTVKDSGCYTTDRANTNIEV